MVAKPYPLGYTPSMVFNQPAVEAELRRHATRFSDVQAELGVELLDLVQTSDRVEARLKDADGRHRSVTARYVLGCDGASSTVRQIAGHRLEDLIFDEPWLVVDVRVNASALARLPQCSAQFCNPARPVSFLIGPSNHRRWEIMLLPGEDAPQMEQPEQCLEAALALADAAGRGIVAAASLSLPRPRCSRLAQRPHPDRRRRRSSAASLHRPGHVPGPA